MNKTVLLLALRFPFYGGLDSHVLSAVRAEPLSGEARTGQRVVSVFSLESLGQTP